MPFRLSFGCCGRFLIRRRRAIIVGAVLASALLLNLLAYVHARAMTRYSAGGQRTTPPERLSMLGKAHVLFTGINLPRPANATTPAELGLKFQTHTISRAGGLDLEAWLIPGDAAQPVVILFHGYGSCKSQLLEEAKAFHEFGCETVLVDFRGSGGSAGNETTLGVYEADDVAAAVEFAKQSSGARPLILYGKSMGSAAILRAIAIASANPAAVIVECPFDRLLTTVENRFSAMGVPSFPFAQLLVFWGGVQQGMNGFAHNPVDYAANVRCPVLLMHGEQDPRVSVPQVRSIYDHFAGSKELVLFPRAGHESYLESDSERWKRAVGEVIERVTNVVRN
jgi:alpha-beta hydrolase superfamily lysophospholipase